MEPAGPSAQRRADWAAVVAALEAGVVVADAAGVVVACNPSAAELLGVDAAELTGRRAAAIGLTDDEALCAARGGTSWLRVTAAPLAGGARVYSLTDVTAERERERELRRLAELDDLTGLPNRRRFIELLERHLRSKRREDAGGTLVLVDLDRFKELNDSFGHATGDRLLVRVAEALRERLRADDLLARLGGDEFVVLLPRTDGPDAARVAHALVERLAEELVPTPSGGSRPLSASVGVVSLAGMTGGTAERALSRVDAAMYRAKAAGRSRFHVEEVAHQGGDQLEKRTRQLALANAVGSRIAELTDAPAIAEATVEELRRAFGYHLCAVIRIREDDRVHALAVRGDSFDLLFLREWSQPRDVGLIGRCLRERTPVLANDVLVEPGYNGTPETSETRSELVVPLLVEGEVWGAINVEETVRDMFDAEDVVLLCTLANQVAAGLRAASLHDRLRTVSAAG